jgi:DtxR family Mn-dependent transcriptional regulator
MPHEAPTTVRSAGHSEAVEMYLKSLAILGGAAHPVAAALLAERLELTPVAASEMLHRLIREGLVSHEPYRGYRLTETGRAAAWDVIRRERLWERFLVDRLALDATLAVGWACLLEHATAPEVIDALDAFLDFPATCPQGQPIPRSASDPVHWGGRSLAEVEVGETVRLVAFDDEDDEVLDYLHRSGLAVGGSVRVAEIGPHRSLMSLERDGGTAVIGLDVAAGIQTAPVSREPVTADA